jgi:hypothetical protein
LTRQYFKRGIEAAKAIKPPKVKRPVHGSNLVMGRLGRPDKGPLYRTMTSREAALQLGRAKGAATLHRLGKAHTWTSEEARAAAKKVWATRWRMIKKIGRRIGRKAKNGPIVRRAKLRERYRNNQVKGVWYDPERACWWIDLTNTPRLISEHAALVRLGHLKSRRKGIVPDSVMPIPLPKRRRT